MQKYRDVRKHRITQRTRLFLVYGIFMLLVLIFLFTYIYIFNEQNVQREAAIKQANICTSVRNSVEAELNNMSTISLNLVYSSAIRKNFSSFSSYSEKDTLNKAETLQSWNNAEAIYDVITAMIGPYQSASQVNLYTMDGIRVGSGYQQSVVKVRLSTIPWWKKVIALNGLKFITPPTKNTSLPTSGSNQNTHMFISMIRPFFYESEQPEGMFEVMQDCNTIFSLATKMEERNDGLHLYIYNKYGELVYPYIPLPNHTNYLSLAYRNHLADEKGSIITVSPHNSQLITKDTIPQYNWTVIAVEPKDIIYAPLSFFRTSFFFLATLIILGTLIICFFLSKQMTQPLIKLTQATKELTIDRILDDKQRIPTSADSNIAEISDLCTSYLNMYDKLRKSSRDLLLARSEEIRANLQATQSLINPHFLFNSLTSISILAEDGQNETISRMCNALCDYFRYISNSSCTLVPLREEIDCTKKYIDCMQIRYEDTFSYTCQIDSAAENILIPKLIVQPIVENAFKHAFNNAPPWQLHLSADTNKDYWKICIEDNGGNLTNQKRDRILRELHHMDHTKELHRMQIGGMGLKNVYLRLTLQYGEKALFDIDNTQKNKTIFSIGGPIQPGRGEKHGK